MRRNRRRSAVVLGVVAACAVVVACESSPASTGAPGPPPFAAGSQAKMNGRKDGVVVPVINVWNTVPPSEAVCTLQHDTPVTVADTRYDAGAKRWYLKIDSGGGCVGWVPETSLAK